MKHFILAVFAMFLYAVPDDFDIHAFLDSCRAQGIKLYAASETDSPHGSIHWGGGVLRVDLFETAEPARDADPRRRTVALPGRAVVPIGMVAARAKIDIAVENAKK